MTIVNTNTNQLTSTGAAPSGNSIQALNGGFAPNVMSSFNGLITECSIQANSGTYKSLGKISFPIEECNVTFSQDVVQHKKPNVPGARVESTGFNPIVFKVKAFFLYGLQRGNGETWDNLYPETFFKVWGILTDQVAPVLTFTHPTMGQFTVKPQNGHTNTTANIRNGQIIEFDLIQANEDDSAVVIAPVAFGTAEAAATIFDNTIINLVPAPPKNILAISLTQLLQTVRGAIDSSTLLINQVTNAVNNAIYQINQVEQALLRLDTAATSNLLTQLKRVKSGIYSLVNNQSTSTPNAATLAAAIQSNQATVSSNSVAGATSAGNLGVFVVEMPMTLANVALLTHNSIDQLINLNPAIAKTPTIRVGTQIVYQEVTEPSPLQ